MSIAIFRYTFLVPHGDFSLYVVDLDPESLMMKELVRISYWNDNPRCFKSPYGDEMIHFDEWKKKNFSMILLGPADPSFEMFIRIA